ncbi:MAG: putative 7-carboxy-7-deazaguanine synthase QueE [Lachnospiraceae bacterium]|nr:putative 7-carboxy-7-deazaguanine synthase QueE [Lachnospiraceae bacterium]
MAEYKVAEIFTSVNGEGMCVGELAVFVRFCGCNLRCNYCDTMWANEPDCTYESMTDDEILQKILKEGIKNVTLTGGEPLLQPQIDVLIQKLVQYKDGLLRIEIETNGSVDISRFIMKDDKGVYYIRPVFTMDYKLRGSGMESGMSIGNFNYLCKNDTVKFVVSDEEDLERAYEISKRYHLNGKCNLILSPVFGRIEPERIVDFMKQKKWNDARMQLQIHKIIWDPDQKGV